MIMQKKSQKGFTLLEVLMYASLVAGFVTVALASTHQILEYSNRLRSMRELGENERFLIQKFNWILSGVQTLNSPAVGASSTSLSVTKLTFPANPLLVSLATGTIQLKAGASSTVALSNNYFASTSNLKFENIQYSNQYAIRITAQLTNDFATTSIDTTIFYK